MICYPDLPALDMVGAIVCNPYPVKAPFYRRPLTRTERAVMVDLVSGKTAKQIALETGRSVRTVEVHMTAIRNKSGAAHIRQACAMFARGEIK